jgi:hypothetical protein
MSEGTAAASSSNATLLCRTGARAGARFPLRHGITRVGRAPDNDAVIDGPEAIMVSQYHCEILRESEGFRVRDCNSTNGTWIDGERVDDAPISPSTLVRLGQQGPEFTIVSGDAAPEPLERTIEIQATVAAENISGTGTVEEMLSAAVRSARRMRARGIADQTMTIMRDVVQRALRDSHRRHRVVRYMLVFALLAVSGVGIWKTTELNREKRAIDAQILDLEAQLQKTSQGADTDRLLSRLSDYQEQAESLQHNLLYRIEPHDEGDFVTRGLRSVMTEFGAEAYSIPPDFVQRVNEYIAKDCGTERPKIAQALHDSADRLQTIRRILDADQMPADLAYIPIVESALSEEAESAAGALGPWQLTAPTAREYGLRVDDEADERKDLVKSTEASCRYLKNLILDFGAGSSVMLALAAYNGGATKVKQAVTRNVRNPIQQRNFWYLYRVRALPLETSEYVPKVFAAILIGRDPHHFGF